LASRTL